MSAATRKDVAKLAGVSETIVSYVLNNNRSVSAEKKERVLKAVETLHYRPNSIARALKGKGTRQILFIVDNVSNDYFGRLVNAIDAVAYEHNYFISLVGAKNDKEFVERMLSRSVDAVLISSATIEERIVQQLVDADVPVVLLMTKDYANIEGRLARIYTGIESGIMSAVRLQYDSGCRNIVYVDRVSSIGHFSNRQDLRYRGFCNQMEALDISLNADHFISGCKDEDELFSTVCDRIRSGKPADGFVCRNDRIACTVLNAVIACGKKVPEDICITGFDNSAMSRLIHPSLSTVSHNEVGIAQAIMDMIEEIAKGGSPQDRHFLTQLIPRETTRKN